MIFSLGGGLLVTLHQDDINLYKDRPRERVNIYILISKFRRCSIQCGRWDSIHSTTQAGSYWVFLLFSYGAGSFSYLVLAIFECVAIAWFYGGRRFFNDIRAMWGYGWMGWRTFWWWHLNWLILTPGVLAVSIFLHYLCIKIDII